MAIRRKSGVKQSKEAIRSKKCGILLPSRVYAIYEEVAYSERITVSQVIARVAIEFANVEYQASCSRRYVLGDYKAELSGKPRASIRLVGRKR